MALLSSSLITRAASTDRGVEDADLEQLLGEAAPRSATLAGAAGMSTMLDRLTSLSTAPMPGVQSPMRPECPAQRPRKPASTGSVAGPRRHRQAASGPRRAQAADIMGDSAARWALARHERRPGGAGQTLDR